MWVDYAAGLGSGKEIPERSWSSDILETREPRKYPVELRGPEKDVDRYEITLPAGFEMDALPLPADYASYHSKTEAKGNVLTYTRTRGAQQLGVPADKLDQLKSFYRAIAGDERNTAVLKAADKQPHQSTNVDRQR